MLCQTCGYFGGDGFRHELAAHRSRGVVAQVEVLPLNDKALSPDDLIRHLNETPDHLLTLSPFTAEKVICKALAEFLSCEVRAVGGVKDGGVDGYVIAGDKFKTIIQIKWHESKKNAESIKVVRELAGTLIARGVPHGLLVTTRSRISAEAQQEIDHIRGREIIGIGTIQVDVKTYADILAMLNIAAIRLGSIDAYRSVMERAARYSGFWNTTGNIAPPEAEPPGRLRSPFDPDSPIAELL
ncbi:MAG: restriction endonuclease [Acidobacteria bacterium]|nr:restriction endonuclease [Acidobacteriota bacterium]